jgi:dihydrofolate reductase
LSAAARLGQPVYIVGGAELYQKALPLATELHISWVEGDFAGDCFFPSFNLNDWDVCETKDFPGFCYVKYQRKQVVRTG